MAPENKRRGRPFEKGNTIGPRFQKGVSGNPGGRPKGVRERIRLEIGEDGNDALLILLRALRGEKVTPDERWAAEQLLDRGFGKATQPMEHEVHRRRTVFVFSAPEPDKAPGE